jgi:hypothetical protein
VANERAHPANAGSPPRRQHLVSQFVLRQWAEGNVVSAIDLRHGRTQERAPRAEGFAEWFVREDFARAIESVWQPIEARAASVLDLLLGGSRQLSTDDSATIRQLVALHVVRSRGIQAMVDRLVRQSSVDGQLREILELLNDDSAIAALAEARLGIVPAGDEMIAIARNRELARLGKVFDPGGEFFVDQVLQNFDRATEALSHGGVEIGRVVDGELIIADNPAVPYNASTRAWGFLNGARLGDGPVMMPLAPTILVSVGGPDGETEIPRSAAEHLNKVQIHNAVNKVYARPGANLEDWVLAYRASVSSGPSDEGAQPTGT